MMMVVMVVRVHRRNGPLPLTINHEIEHVDSPFKTSRTLFKQLASVRCLSVNLARNFQILCNYYSHGTTAMLSTLRNTSLRNGQTLSAQLRVASRHARLSIPSARIVSIASHQVLQYGGHFTSSQSQNRFYATGRGPVPPGGTHRMNLGM